MPHFLNSLHPLVVVLLLPLPTAHSPPDRGTVQVLWEMQDGALLLYHLPARGLERAAQEEVQQLGLLLGSSPFASQPPAVLLGAARICHVQVLFPVRDGGLPVAAYPLLTHYLLSTLLPLWDGGGIARSVFCGCRACCYCVARCGKEVEAHMLPSQKVIGAFMKEFTSGVGAMMK